MKNILISLSAALLLASCAKDEMGENSPNEGNAAPQMIATVEQGSLTRSGVVEDGDYTLGEKFYWSNADNATVYFTNPTMTDPQEYKKAEYEAEVSAGVQSNSAAFNATQSDQIDNGEYTAYGLFPTSAWDTRTDYATFLTANVPASQTQTGANSEHLGAYMLMKASADVTVDGDTPVELTYKHLASVLRFAVWNNSGNNDLKLADINVRLGSGKAAFETQARLANALSDVLGDIDAASLTPTPISESLRASALTLALTGNAQNFAAKAEKELCEGYMAVMPTAADAFESTDDLIVELSLTDGTNNYLVTKTYNVGDDLAFLQNGIEAGKSYYFQIETAAADLIPITGDTYTVGDYWPNADDPQGVVFWVKPGSFGTQGKVVALGETYAAKWGPEIDEQAAGVTDIRSLTDGAAATKNMIAKYKGSATFSTDYPAFHYIYNTVNGGDADGAWYLPARNELKMLFAGASGRVYEIITGWTSDAMPGYYSQECTDAREAFDAKITDKGGAAFGSGNNSVNWYYLSSTEDSAEGAVTLNFEEGYYTDDSKSYDGNIRWIREFPATGTDGGTGGGNNITIGDNGDEQDWTN